MSAPTPRPRAPREAQIRAALKRHLADTLAPGVAIVDELGIKHGKYRVDVCAIDALLHGYEIKSDQDTLERLPAQAKHFSLVFQRMTLVIGPRLLGAALAGVPSWWGLMLVTVDEAGQTVFSTLREAAPNPKPNYRWVVRLLWRDELTASLRAAGVRGYSKLKYWEVANQMLATFTPDELTALVTRVLRDRKAGVVAPDEDEPAPSDVPSFPDAIMAHDADWEETDHSTWDWDDHRVG